MPYISSYVASVLTHGVEEEGEKEGVRKVKKEMEKVTRKMEEMKKI